MPVEQLSDKVILKSPKGATAEILYYGATVISWKTPGGVLGTAPTEHLFLSSKAAVDGSKAVRGGIPVVFPCFGPPEHPEHKRLSQHGFARTEKWAFDSVVMDNEAGVSIRLLLHPSPTVKSVYDKPFELAYIVTLAETQLSTDLHVTNPSTTEPLEFQALLHTYLRAPSNTVTISPLTGKSYIDKVDGGNKKEEKREVVDVKQFTDSVYEDAPSKVNVIWPGGGVEVKLTEFKTLTVWNPQKDAGSKIGDMEENGWDNFVCVEPGYVRGFVNLEPGKRWIGQQVLSLV